VFIIALWSIFMVFDLKELLHNSNNSVIYYLFPLSWQPPWLFVWRAIFIET
jgi:hypothetical protein